MQEINNFDQYFYRKRAMFLGIFHALRFDFFRMQMDTSLCSGTSGLNILHGNVHLTRTPLSPNGFSVIGETELQILQMYKYVLNEQTLVNLLNF